MTVGGGPGIVLKVVFRSFSKEGFYVRMSDGRGGRRRFFGRANRKAGLKEKLLVKMLENVAFLNTKDS